MGPNRAHSGKWMLGETEDYSLKGNVKRGGCKRSWEYIEVGIVSEDQGEAIEGL